MNKFKRTIKKIGPIFLCLILLSGCASLPATKSNNLASTGKLLIMPPRDVIQRGKAHPEGEGSGKQLQEAIVQQLKQASSYEIMVYEVNDRFNFTIPTRIEDAISESEKMGADYCLILTLGEFVDATTIPFVIRNDWVFLDRGILIDVKTKEEVWALDEPFRAMKGDLGGYRTLLDILAKMVARSITK